MRIRTATIEDLDAIARVEAECFPVAEAATKSVHGNVEWNQMRLTFDDRVKEGLKDEG